MLYACNFINLKGIELTSNPFSKVTFTLEYKILLLDKSNLNFFLNGTLITKNNCNSSLPKMELNSYFTDLIITRTKFTSAVCPFVFKDTYFVTMVLFAISSSFIEKNIFKFEKIQCPSLNSTIENIILQFYHADLNEHILNR